MKNITLLLAGMFIGITFFSSCTTVNTVEREESVGTKQVVADKRVITDATLNKKVSIVGLNEVVTPGGFLQLQIEILNRKNSMQEVSYKIEWFDENGMRVDTPASVWVPRQIEGQETLSITATAPKQAARDFRVKFMENVRDN